MVDDLDSARKTYSLRIIQLWLECIDLSHESQKLFLRGEPENEINYEYVARLVRLWKEFKPKVKNRTELENLMGQYEQFNDYCIDPRKLLEDPDKIFLLEEVICDVMDKLGLTLLENIK